MTQFKNTYTQLKNYVSAYTPELPMSYETWVKLPKAYKTPALFVNFFDQITLAWNKLRTDAAVEEEVIEEVFQYLWKNEPIIERDRKRYTPNNIYTVVSNAIYCKSIDPYAGQTARNSWYNNVQSNVVVFDEDETDLFEMMAAASFSSKIVDSDGWQTTDMSDVCKTVARKVAFEKAGIWKSIFGELDYIDTVTRKRKIIRDNVVIDVKTIEDDELSDLKAALRTYGYNIVKRVDNAKYVISNCESLLHTTADSKIMMDADRYDKPIFTPKEFISNYCKGAVKEEYTEEVEVYSGGMDKDTQLIVKYLMGEDITLTAAIESKIPEVKEKLRQLILNNKASFEFVGCDLSTEF